MGKPQTEFLTQFESRFNDRVSRLDWLGGQNLRNRAEFKAELRHPELRLDGDFRRNEGFEMGDLRADYKGWRIIIEYESDFLNFSNLMKYWAFLYDDLLPLEPIVRKIVLCHYSNWSSYGSHRDLWQWIYEKIREDLLGNGKTLTAAQFHNGKGDDSVRERIDRGVDFIVNTLDS